MRSFLILIGSILSLGSSFDVPFDIPEYADCETEFANFNVKHRYDPEIFGPRSQNVDRQGTFCTNLEDIKAHNTRALAGEYTWSKGVNEFTDWTDEEKDAYHGSVPVLSHEQEVAMNLNLTVFETAEVYNAEANKGGTSDFRSRMPAIKQQGGCGSCWAFSAIDVVDFWGGSHSEQQLVDCSTSRDGCQGGFPLQALQYLAQRGSETESQYPYTSGRSGRGGTCKSKSGGTKVSNVQSVAGSASAIASAGSKQVVSTCITFPGNSRDDFMNYHQGVFDGRCGNSKPQTEGHAIAVVGVQSNYYIIRNSWGRSWGMNGYMYMARGKNVCQMEHGSCTASTAKASSAIVV